MMSKRSKIVEFFTEKSVEDSISEVETGYETIIQQMIKE
jgi:hypothetical protein